MADKYDSGVAVLPVAHPNGEVHNVAVPTGISLSDLHNALSDSGYATPAISAQDPQPTAENALENDPSFKKATTEAYSRAMANMNPGSHTAKEWGFSVGPSGQTGPMVSMDDAPTKGQLSLDVHPSDIGVVHTHDFRHEATPSPRDIQSAKDFKKTIYVASRDGLYAVDPGGTVSKLYNSPEDIGNKKKKANLK